MKFPGSYIIIWAIGTLLGLASVGTPADAQDDAATQALLTEFSALVGEKNTGFRASEAVLSQSFAAHLHGPSHPASVADLSRLGAAYDPAAAGPFTAGMLYFHLARPVAILRELGGGPNEVFARIIEIRLRWLSGAPDLALAQASDLIAQMDKAGMAWSDPEMVSLLADAAVLAWRAGQVEVARAYFERAHNCGSPRCPDDLVFGWLGTDRKANGTRLR